MARFWVEEKEIDRLAKRFRYTIRVSGMATDFMIYVLSRYYSRLLRDAMARRDKVRILDLIPRQIAFSIMNRRAASFSRRAKMEHK
jgi:hypothetical protein